MGGTVEASVRNEGLQSAFHSVIVPFGSEVNKFGQFVILISSWLQGNSLTIEIGDHVIICKLPRVSRPRAAAPPQAELSLAPNEACCVGESNGAFSCHCHCIHRILIYFGHFWSILQKLTGNIILNETVKNGRMRDDILQHLLWRMFCARGSLL